MSEETYAGIAKEIIDHSKGGRNPCPNCGRVAVEHSDTEADQCWLEIEAREEWQKLVDKLLVDGAISRQTLQQNRHNADLRKFNPVTSQLLMSCFPWNLDEKWRSTYLYGDFGTGKTYVARCILNEALKTGRALVDINGARLAKMLRQQFNQDKVVEWCKYYSMLLIDDIDKVFWKEREIEGLWEIFEARSDRGLKTIITANIHPKEFRDMIALGCGGNQTIAESLIQRLHPCLILEFKGESLR